MKNSKQIKGSQFTLVDQVFKHDRTNLAHIFIFSGQDVPQGVPLDWRSPTNFSQGKIYIRVRVLQKPTKIPVRYMMYLMSGGHGDEYRAVIGHNIVQFSEPGTYQFEQDVVSISGYEAIHWEQPLDEMLVSVWDQHNFPVDTRWGHGGKWDGSPHIERYYPMKVHYTAVVVAENSSFQGFPSRLALFQSTLNRLVLRWRYWLRNQLKRR